MLKRQKIKILSPFKSVDSRLDLEYQMYPKTRSLGAVPFIPGSTQKASENLFFRKA